MRNGWNWKYPLSLIYPAHTQLLAKCSSPSIGDRRATGCLLRPSRYGEDRCCQSVIMRKVRWQFSRPLPPLIFLLQFEGLLAWNWWSSSKTRRQYLNQKNPPFPPETNCQIEIATPFPHGHRSIGDWGQLRMLWSESDQTTLHRTPSNVANWNWKNQTMTNTLGVSYPFEVWFCRKAFLLGGCKEVSYLCSDNLLTPKDNRQNWQKNRWESLQNGEADHKGLRKKSAW